MIESVAVLIGNSDNKLSQEQWCCYTGKMRETIAYWFKEIHFVGGSSFDSKFQNACYVGTIETSRKRSFLDVVGDVRDEFYQDSAAVIFGQTTMA